MARRYSAFLLRDWHIGDDGARRVEVVHIQSSARAVVSSLGAAADWIDALSRDSSPPHTARVTAPGELVPKRAAPLSALPTRGRRSDAEGTAGRTGVQKMAATGRRGDDCIAPAENERRLEEKP